MCKDKLENYLLYILSQKKRLRFSRFKDYINTLSSNKGKDKFYAYNLVRILNALSYIDIKNTQSGIVINVNHSRLIPLHFLKPTLLLTGARTEDLIEDIKKMCKKYFWNFHRDQNDNLPDTIRIEIGDIEDFKEKWRHSDNLLFNYIEVYENQVGPDILNSCMDCDKYQKPLDSWYKPEYELSIKKVFNTKSLEFDIPAYQKDTDMYLVKIVGEYGLYSYYLFRQSNQDRLKVDLDWGKFIVLKNKDILQYNKSTFELCSKIRLPSILERSLTLFFGIPPVSVKKNKDENNVFIFKNISYQVASVVFKKLAQQINNLGRIRNERPHSSF